MVARDAGLASGAAQADGAGVPVSVRAALARVLTAVESREDDIVEAMIRRNVAEVPGLGPARDEPTVVAAFRASARANLQAGLAMLSDKLAARPSGPVLPGRDELPVTLPFEAVREARESARARVPLEALLHTYRIGHAVAWDALMEEVERTVEQSLVRQALLRMLNRYAFAYVDGVLPIVAREYHAEGRRLSRRVGQRRVDAVVAVLDGSATDVRDLNYEMRGWHLGLVAWGSCVEAAVSAIADRLERPVLCVRPTDATAWGWLGGRGRFRPEASQDVLEGALPDGASVAFGGVMQGLEGFQRTHRQARDAQGIGMALRNRVTLYSEVAVEALALRDPDAARVFVDHVLGPLEQARNGAKLRLTLAAYFRCGLNASATAASIGVSERTVAYRLKVLEEVTGQPLAARRFELEAALRLQNVIGR